MDTQLFYKGLEFAHIKKKWILVLAAFGFTGYGVYRVYHLPSVERNRKRTLKLLTALTSVAETVSDSAEAAGIFAKDLKEFLQSDSDEIPNSLKQISKISKSEELLGSIARLTEAVTAGILKGYRLETRDDGGMNGKNSGSSDQYMDKLFSTAGSGFASAVVGSFARNLVMALFDAEESNHGSSNSSATSMNVDSSCSGESSIPRWVAVMCSDKCRELIGDSIQLSLSTAVAVFLDKTAHINTYDDFFAGLTNPRHDNKVKDLLVSVCNGAVETLVKTSHQVLRSSNSVGNSDQVSFPVPRLLSAGSSLDANPSPERDHDDPVEGHKLSIIKQNGFGQSSSNNDLKVSKSAHESRGGGWLYNMSSTLSAPDNRRFVLDLTGRVTFETVRSFLEFVLEKVLQSLRRSYDVVHEVAICKGLEVVRYVSAKSSVVATICLSLCLHVFDGGRVLMPA
ncbi:hypothetical protein Ancab_025870 [Ancistrocladus abbreviatus]